MIEPFGGWGHFLFFGENVMSLKIPFSILPLESEEMEKNKIMIFFFSCWQTRVLMSKNMQSKVFPTCCWNEIQSEQRRTAKQSMRSRSDECSILGTCGPVKKNCQRFRHAPIKKFPAKMVVGCSRKFRRKKFKRQQPQKKKRNNHHHKSHLLVLIHTTGGRESVLIWRQSFENVPLSWKQRRHATRVRTDCRREHSRGIFRWLWKLSLFVFFGVLKKWHHDHESRWMVRTPQLDEANSRRCESLALLK